MVPAFSMELSVTKLFLSFLREICLYFGSFLVQLLQFKALINRLLDEISVFGDICCSFLEKNFVLWPIGELWVSKFAENLVWQCNGENNAFFGAAKGEVSV